MPSRLVKSLVSPPMQPSKYPYGAKEGKDGKSVWSSLALEIRRAFDICTVIRPMKWTAKVEKYLEQVFE